MPKRIQLSRARGWRKPEGAVVVIRPGLFGNPWRASPCASILTDDTRIGPVGEVAIYDHRGIWNHYQTCPHAESIEATVSFFETWIKGRGIGGLPSGLTKERLNGWREAMVTRRHRILDRLHILRGKDLCCWCPPDQPCHADVLLEIANAPIPAVGD